MSRGSRQPRALLVSYAFPPTGGAGVGRALKLAKYLPDHGIRPQVLTVANPSVPVTDATLARDLPAEVAVARARTLEPGYRVKRAAWAARAGTDRGAGAALRRAVPALGQLLVPDPQVLWQPGAQLELARIQRAGIDAVWISGPPFSQFLLAPTARLRGAAVVLDYRDEWITYRSSYEMIGSLPARVGGPLERALLRSAHAITTATAAFRDNLLHRFGFLDPQRVHTVTNGFDPDDFPPQLPAPPSDRFVLTYAGTVFALTSPRPLLAAIRRLHGAHPELASLLRVRFIGRVVDTERAALDEMAPLGVECTGYADKPATIAALAASHMVACTLADVPGAERIYPGKIFELMYLRRPCITIAPPGALRELVARHACGRAFDPADEVGIAAALADALAEFRDGRYRASFEPVDVGRFHRRALAGEHAAVIREAIAAAGGGSR